MHIVADLVKKQQWAAAEVRLREMQKQSPFNHQLAFQLSWILSQQGKTREAISALRQCLSAAPTFVPAMVNLTILLLQSGDSIGALHYAQLAVDKQPREAALYFYLSLAWKECRNSAQAFEAINKALAIRPQVAEWMVIRMNSLCTMQRDHDAAEEAMRIRSLPGHADHAEALAILETHFSTNSQWNQLDNLQASLQRMRAQAGAGVSPSRLMLSIDEPDTIYQLGLRSVTPTLRASPIKRPARSRDKLVIGYLSADIRDHPVAQMLLEVVSHHDRSRFELVLLRLAPADNSEVAANLTPLFDRDFDLTQLSDLQAAEKITAEGIDVLVDLMGLTKANRIAILAGRPAPVQVLWLGCPVTTAHPYYDAFVVDTIVAPTGYEAFCSEPLVRLPCCYHPISVGLRGGTPTFSRDQLNVPDTAMLIGVLQQPDRIRPDFIRGIAQTLSAHPQAHLFLRAKEESKGTVVQSLTACGLSAERIHFAPRFPLRCDYLSFVAAMHLLIDSHPYGGHSTTGEALALGVPVLVHTGRSIHARVATSMLHELGLADLAATSPDHQRALLSQLLTEPDLLNQWKCRFAEAASTSSEARNERLTRALETTYVELIQKATVA